MTTQNPFPHPLIVDTDPEDSECFSVWCDNGQGSSGEIAGRICDETYASYIVRAVNSHAALVEALGDLLMQLEGVGIYAPGEDIGQWADAEGLSFAKSAAALKLAKES